MHKSLIYTTKRLVGGQLKPVGGFADRIKGLIFCYIASLICERRFLVDWGGEAPITDWFKPNEINWYLPEDEAASLRLESPVIDLVDKKFTPRLKAQLSASSESWVNLFGHSSCVFVNANGFDASLISQASAYLPIEVPSDESSIGLFAWAFNRLFSYHPQGPQWPRYQEFLSLKNVNDFVVGIQFRTGGGGAWTDPVLDKIENAENIADSAIHFGHSLLRGSGSANIGYFVTSDSIEARERIVDRLPKSSDVLFYDDDPVHIDRSASPTMRNGAAQVVLEHSVLSECDGIVFGRGAFGRVAAWRSNIPYKRYY